MSAAPRYLARVLRLWTAGQVEARHGRAPLEDIHSPARFTFADIRGLVHFLDTLAAPPELADGDEEYRRDPVEH